VLVLLRKLTAASGKRLRATQNEATERAGAAPGALWTGFPN
jgi:hypothetical protein